MKDFAVEGWEIKGIETLEAEGAIQLGRGKVISKKDLAATPGSYPVYSSAKENDGKFGEYGNLMFDEELITWSVDGGGRLFHRPKHKFSITNVGGFVRILQPERINCRYLYYALSFLHSKVKFDWVRKAHPSVIRKVYKKIPLPPIEEQKCIVAVLDEAFHGLARARDNAEANIQNAQELFEQAEVKLFKNVSEEATQTTLGQLATFRNGLNYSRSSQGDEVKVVGVGDFQDNFTIPTEMLARTKIDGQLGEDDKLIAGDILAVRSNGNRELIGRTMLMPEPEEATSFSGFTIRVRLDNAEVLPEYVCSFLRTKAARTKLTAGGGGANISNLNQRILSAFPIYFPDKARQNQTLARLNILRDQRTRLTNDYSAKIKNIDNLRQSLLQKAFAGELT